MPAKHVVGVLSPYLTGPFFRPLLRALSAQLAQSGCRTLLLRWSPERVARSGLASAQVDGWIVCVDVAGLAELARGGLPLVLVSAQDDQVACSGVLADDFGGCYAVTRHVLAHGHRRVGFVGGRMHYDVTQRFEGFQAALAEAGLASDPALVLDTEGLSEHDGLTATRRLIASGAEFSALVAASDLVARGVLQALHEAGRRVPEDVALAGFDDLDEAQYIDPPLTTVRQQPALIGRLAAKLMLDRLAGQPAEPVSVLLPTALVVRASCGCPLARPVTPPVRDDLDDWRALLVQDLLRLVLAPLPHDPATPPEQIWPGAATLIEAATAALRRAALPDDHALQQSAQQAVLLIRDVQAMFNLVDLVRQSALQAVGRPDGQSAERLERLLDRFQQHMLRAYMAKNAERIFQFSHLAMTGYQAMSQMFAADGLSALTWLSTTAAQWGLLALWEQPAPGARPALLTRGRYRLEGAADTARLDAAEFPPLDGPFARLSGASPVIVVPVSTPARDWGLLAYAEPLTDNDYDTTSIWMQHLGVVLERDTALASMHEQQQTLRHAYERERALAETVRALGCPIIPLLRGVLLVPLVGAIDEQRAEQIIEQVLASVSREQASRVLIDITGVPVVDTHVAGALVRTAQAVTLLGAQVTLVGVRPEIAQSIIGLGVELLALSTQPTLAAALERLGIRG